MINKNVVRGIAFPNYSISDKEIQHMLFIENKYYLYNYNRLRDRSQDKNAIKSVIYCVYYLRSYGRKGSTTRGVIFDFRNYDSSIGWVND